MASSATLARRLSFDMLPTLLGHPFDDLPEALSATPKEVRKGLRKGSRKIGERFVAYSRAMSRTSPAEQPVIRIGMTEPSRVHSPGGVARAHHAADKHAQKSPTTPHHRTPTNSQDRRAHLHRIARTGPTRSHSRSTSEPGRNAMESHQLPENTHTRTCNQVADVYT